MERAARQCASCFEGKIIEQKLNVHHLFYEDPLVKTRFISCLLIHSRLEACVTACSSQLSTSAETGQTRWNTHKCFHPGVNVIKILEFNCTYLTGLMSRH